MACFFIGLLFAALIPVNQYFFFTSVGFLTLSVYLIPFVLKSDFELVSAWSFLGVSLVLGCLLRGIYIGLEYPSFLAIDHYYLLGQEIDYFVWPAVMLISCLLIAALTYSFAPIKNKRSLLATKHHELDKRRLYIFAVSSLAVSLLSIGAYIVLTGGFDASNISSKRSTIESIGLSEEHRTWQSLKVLASIAMVAHLFVLSDALVSKSGRGAKYALAVLLFMAAAFLPFYTSTRSEILFYFIFSFLVFYQLRGGIQIHKALVFLVMALAVFQVMSVLRSSSDTSLSESLTGSLEGSSVLDSAVLNRNGVELAKTAHVVNSIPRLIDYQYGKTIAVWLVAPIPRELWNSKPLISAGPIIGTEVYGNRVSGVPPGFVGEMYWNFHLFGVIFGGLFIGWLIKWIDVRMKPSDGSLAVFLFGPAQIAHLVFGVGLGYGVVTIAIRTAIAYGSLCFIRGYLRSAPVAKPERARNVGRRHARVG